jgi:PTH1 family peptidyl-tRNA hydrolase
MKVIIGLGNPEERYTNTRHNVGFRMVGDYAAMRGTDFQLKEKFKARIAEMNAEKEKVLLVKPTTYYNNVGEAARLICDFYKLTAHDVLIIHDELALPFGTIRTRLGGSSAGNNGIKSMNQHIGEETARVRVGVYNDLRDRIHDADFVLSNFTKEESETLPVLVKTAADLIDGFVRGDFVTTTHS